MTIYHCRDQITHCDTPDVCVAACACQKSASAASFTGSFASLDTSEMAISPDAIQPDVTPLFGLTAEQLARGVRKVLDSTRY